MMKHRDDLGREEFLESVWEWKDKHGGIIIQQLKQLGCSCDWGRERFTMDAAYTRWVQRVFVELFKKGLIYRGKRMVNWCPVSPHRAVRRGGDHEAAERFMYLFQSTNSPTSPARFWNIATTRPETIPGDAAVAVNPKDPRYAHLIGKHVCRAAAVGQRRSASRSSATTHVDFEFGTGVLKVTPAHDKADFEIGQRHNLAIIDVLHPDGAHERPRPARTSRASTASWRARRRSSMLEELGVLVKEEPYENNVGYSRARRCADRAAPQRAVVPEISVRGGSQGRGGERRHASSAPSAGRRSTSTGWKTSRTGASAASSGGGIGFRCGIGRQRLQLECRSCG